MIKTILTCLLLTILIHASSESAPANTNARGPTATIRITGQVKRPGAYPFRDGETLTKAIERAGGFADEFTSDHIRLFRNVGGFEDVANKYHVGRWTPADDPSGWGALSKTNRPQMTDERDCIGVSIRAISKGKEPDIPLKKGDWIAVRREDD